MRRLSRSLLVAGWFGVGLSGKARVTILKTDLTVLTGVYGLTEVLNVKYEFDWF